MPTLASPVTKRLPSLSPPSARKSPPMKALNLEEISVQSQMPGGTPPTRPASRVTLVSPAATSNGAVRPVAGSASLSAASSAPASFAVKVQPESEANANSTT